MEPLRARAGLALMTPASRAVELSGSYPSLDPVLKEVRQLHALIDAVKEPRPPNEGLTPQ